MSRQGISLLLVFQKQRLPGKLRLPPEWGLWLPQYGRLARDLPQGSSGHSPVIVSESGPPVGGPQKRLYSTGQVYKQVTHQKEPAEPEAVGAEKLPWYLLGT